MRKLIIILVIILLIIASLLIYLYSFSREDLLASSIEGVSKSINIYSPSFPPNGKIPDKYTCNGLDISPSLKWGNFTSNVKSFVIIVYDPDAPKKNFIHWIIYNIPANITELPEGIEKTEKTLFGYQGINDFGRIGWNGPCPPSGSSHRYIFRIYALDTLLNLPPGISLNDLLTNMKGHVLSYGETTGIYK